MAFARQVRERLEQTGPDGRKRSENAALAQRVAEVETALLALRYTTYRVLADEVSGKAPAPEVSVITVRGGEIMQPLTALLMEMAGAGGMVQPLTLPNDGVQVVTFEPGHMAQPFRDRSNTTTTRNT